MYSIKRFFTKALASLMLAGLCLCFPVSVLKAQCPTDVYPTSTDPGYVPWTSGFSRTYAISSTCEIIVTYCMRTIANTPYNIVQRYIYSIVQNPSNCTNIDPSQIINTAIEDLSSDVGAYPNGLVAPCTDHETITQLYRKSCWKINSYTGAYEPCNVNAYCKLTCDVCVDGTGTVVSVTNCSYQVIGDSNPDCQALPTGQNYWIPGTCYLLHCGNN